MNQQPLSSAAASATKLQRAVVPDGGSRIVEGRDRPTIFSNAEYRVVIMKPLILRVASPQYYLHMLSAMHRAEDGYLYAHPSELKTRHKYNSARLSIIITNGEVWDVTCVAFLSLEPRTRTYWSNYIAKHAADYLENDLSHSLNQFKPETESPWRLHSVVGWRMTNQRIHRLPPGLYVMVSPTDVPNRASLPASSAGYINSENENEELH